MNPSELNLRRFARRGSVLVDEARILAIALAVLGAVFLSLGAQFQNDAVASEQGAPVKSGGLRIKQIVALLSRPKWLLGMSFLGLAILCQLAALSLAPLIVVQPVGVIALIMTSLLNARIYKVKLDLKTLAAIAITTLGVASFVVFAAGSAIQTQMSDAKLLVVVGILVLLLAVFGLLFYFSKGRVGPLNYIFGAGVLYGFVASLAKVVLLRVQQQDFDWLTLLALVALLAATALGGWFVQNAYASGPPDLVVAGLTVVDPAVAIAIAIVILGEASEAGLVQILGFTASGIVATVGVVMLAKVHPQLNS
jgi:drug/metabolite transporter (DMT)-like permease